MCTQQQPAAYCLCESWWKRINRIVLGYIVTKPRKSHLHTQNVQSTSCSYHPISYCKLLQLHWPQSSSLLSKYQSWLLITTTCLYKLWKCVLGHYQVVGRYFLQLTSIAKKFRGVPIWIKVPLILNRFPTPLKRK